MTALQKNILISTGLTEEQLQNNLFEIGMETVEHLAHGNKDSALIVAKYKFFWGWWQNVWARHDEQWHLFYRLNMKRISTQQCQQHYLDFHRAASLGNTSMANNVKDSYHTFMHMLNKERQHSHVSR